METIFLFPWAVMFDKLALFGFIEMMIFLAILVSRLHLCLESGGAELGLMDDVEANVLTTTYDKIFNWARRSAIWPMQFGLACCAIEMMAVLDPRHDMSGSVRRCSVAARGRATLMIVAGTVTEKMAPIVRRLWDQMPEPKWALAMGACATCGGPYRTYAVTQGVDRVMPGSSLRSRMSAETRGPSLGSHASAAQDRPYDGLQSR